MSALRATVCCTVRTPVDTKSGTLDNGNPWSFKFVEVLDADANKVQLRVPESVGSSLVVGDAYDLTVDIDTRGRFKATIVDVKPAAKTAKAA